MNPSEYRWFSTIFSKFYFKRVTYVLREKSPSNRIYQPVCMDVIIFSSNSYIETSSYSQSIPLLNGKKKPT